MTRVIVLDKMSPDGLKILESAARMEHELRPGLKGDELRAALLEFDAAICRSGVRITSDVLQDNGRLRLIVIGLRSTSTSRPAWCTG